MSNNIESSLKYKLSASVLKLLDFLLPLLRLDINIVKNAIENFHGTEYAKTGKPLHSFYLPAAEALSFFKSNLIAVGPLISCLSDTVPYVGQRTRLLDVLTVLTIVVRAPLLDKAKLLFEWFNTSRSGVISEVELNLFLLTLSSCLMKIKVIGRIEFTREDVNHMAFLARVNQDLKYLLSGLSFNDFYRWLSQNPLADAIFSFVRVLCRLVDVVYSLGNRTAALKDILDEMESHKKYSYPPIPHHSLFNTSLRDSREPLHVLFCSYNQITLLLSNPNPDATCIYIECKKFKLVPDPYYQPSDKHVAMKQQATPSNIKTCCHKHYYLTSFQKYDLPTSWWSHLGTTQRAFAIPIYGLEPDSKYRLTLYTERLKYPEVAVQTTIYRRPPQRRGSAEVRGGSFRHSSASLTGHSIALTCDSVSPHARSASVIFVPAIPLPHLTPDDAM